MRKRAVRDSITFSGQTFLALWTQNEMSFTVCRETFFCVFFLRLHGVKTDIQWGDSGSSRGQS